MKRILIPLLITLIMLSCSITAYADDFPIPNPEVRGSDDGSRVFVFNPYKDDAFPAMGVYSNTEPMELIYPVNINQMVFMINFYFSSDMQYLVFLPEVNKSMAVEFYDNGDLIQTYWIGNLVKDMDQVSYSVSMAFWENRSKRVFDSSANTLSITTVDNLTYVFDITTGKVISGEIIESPGNTLDENILIQPAIPFVDEGPGTLILEGPYGEVSVEVIFGNIDETDEHSGLQYDNALIIGISVFALCIIGLITSLVYIKRKATRKDNT